jgi:glycosyltransferase involved in cell wall biosynthesis
MIRVALDMRMASWTGVGRYSVGLARALARRDDIEPVLLIAHGESVPEVLCDCERHHVQGHPFAPTGAYALAKAIVRVAPDLTHCLHFPVPLPATHPLVVTVHDLTPLLVPGVMRSAVRRMVFRGSVRRAVQVADRVITPSRFTHDDIASMFPALADNGRVTLEGADDFADGPLAALEGRFEQITVERYVLSMGSTRPHKDLPTLLAAFVPLAAAHPELRLVLAGAGDDAYLDTHLAGASDDIRARVAFSGRTTDAQLRSLYANAAVFAFPSRYEGFGLPPLEAMALGAPVVTTTAASLPEVTGDAALLVEPGDHEGFTAAIGRVLDDATERERLIAAGYARAAQLTWDAAAERTADVYREVLG